MRELDFEIGGAALHQDAALSILPELEAAFADIPTERAGVRLHDRTELAELLTTGPIKTIAACYLGTTATPVRAVLFDKTSATNWALGWHQDRTIVVRERHDVPGFGPWTTKAGLQHVEPPFAIIEAMVTLRIHLDDVPAENAPLMIAPGSHRLGKIAESTIEEAINRLGKIACLAVRGDVWAYATPILHASEASTTGGRRRVLQIDYSRDELPAPLQWRGL